VRLAIVGCGAVTREYHLPTLLSLPRVEITGLCDNAVDNALLARSECNLDARVTHAPAELEGIADAALVATPPRSHGALTRQLLAMGMDVLCEKPLAPTSAEGEAMVEAAARAERLLGVGLITRYHANNLVLRKILEDGLLGQIQEIVAESGAPLDWVMTTASYYSRESTAGGVFFDAGVHLVDRILWLFGMLQGISYEDDSFGGMESNARLSGTLLVQGRSVPCRMGFSWTHELANAIEVVGSTGTATLGLSDGDAVVVRRQIAGEPMDLRISRPASRGPETSVFTRQWEDFLDAIETRRPPLMSAESALPALRLIERAYAGRRTMPQPWVTTPA
jgi:predicted dehydrogenase